jgi:putative ABC transport system permease protein
MPASYLSAFRPAKVLKDASSLKIYSKLSFRKALMVVQFTLSIVFVIVVMVIYQQISFMVNTDYGINDKNILNVRLQGVEFQKLANEVRSLPGVESIGGLSHSLGTWADGSSEYRKALQEQPFSMREFSVDDQYLSNIEVEFLAGKNFEMENQGEQERHVILNVEALSMFDFADPASAIGKPIFVDDSLMLIVVGVVKDFHFRPLTRKIGPLALRYKPSEFGFLSMKISKNKDQVMASVAPIWKKLDPIHPLEYKMMADEIDQAYEDAGFLDILTIVGYITFLVIVLACLGMLGMAMYTAKTKVKEIGVRKVLGASVVDITLLLSRSFLWMIGVALFVGIPISYFIGKSFLIIYAYRIDISIGLVLLGVSFILILGLLTICSQTLRAAVSNPVKSLRSE